MDYEAILFGLLMLLFFGSDLLVMALSVRGLKDAKGKMSWSSMGVVRRGLLVGLLVGLIVVMVVFVYWLATDSILAP